MFRDAHGLNSLPWPTIVPCEVQTHGQVLTMKEYVGTALIHVQYTNFEMKCTSYQNKALQLDKMGIYTMHGDNDMYAQITRALELESKVGFYHCCNLFQLLRI
jgi:hypothetical protein